MFGNKVSTTFTEDSVHVERVNTKTLLVQSGVALGAIGLGGFALLSPMILYGKPLSKFTFSDSALGGFVAVGGIVILLLALFVVPLRQTFDFQRRGTSLDYFARYAIGSMTLKKTGEELSIRFWHKEIRKRRSKSFRLEPENASQPTGEVRDSVGVRMRGKSEHWVLVRMMDEVRSSDEDARNTAPADLAQRLESLGFQVDWENSIKELAEDDLSDIPI